MMEEQYKHKGNTGRKKETEEIIEVIINGNFPPN